MTNRVRTLIVLLLTGVVAATSLWAGNADAQTHRTREGIVIDLTASKLTAQKIAPLNNSLLGAQARLSSDVHAALKGIEGKTVKATLEVGYKVGYPVSVAPSGVKVVTETPSLTLNGGVNAKVQPEVSAAGTGAGVSIGDVGVDLGATANVIPASKLEYEIKPGGIATITLAEIALTKPVADIVLSGVEMEVVNAVGQVSVRPFAKISVTTETGVYVYYSYGATAHI